MTFFGVGFFGDDFFGVELSGGELFGGEMYRIQKLNLAHCGQISKTLNDEIEIIIMQLQYPAMKD